MAVWTHRATWEGNRQEIDRLVYMDGIAVGRIMQRQWFPQQGRWDWSGKWIGPNHTGTVDTMQEALAAVRSEFERVAREDPKRLFPGSRFITTHGASPRSC